MTVDDVFDLTAASKDELAAQHFAAHAGEPSAATQDLLSTQEAAHDQYDEHIAHGSRTIHHDGRSFEDKANAVPQPPSNGNGWPGPGNPPPWWPPTKGGGGSSGGGSGNGSGGGPPGWFKKWAQNQKQKRSGGGGGQRIGGGQLAGPSALGNIPQLGKVPLAQPGASTGPSPIIVVVVLASLGVGGYLLYHKLKLAKHQNAELASGKDPTPDAAT
jgi:hypothetical protein